MRHPARSRSRYRGSPRTLDSRNNPSRCKAGFSTSVPILCHQNSSTPPPPIVNFPILSPHSGPTPTCSPLRTNSVDTLVPTLFLPTKEVFSPVARSTSRRKAARHKGEAPTKLRSSRVRFPKDTLAAWTVTGGCRGRRRRTGSLVLAGFRSRGAEGISGASPSSGSCRTVPDLRERGMKCSQKRKHRGGAEGRTGGEMWAVYVVNACQQLCTDSVGTHV